MKIAVVGLGYVGLPLAIQFARSNVNVIGLDVDKTTVRLINNGQSYTKHIQSSTILKSIMPGDCPFQSGKAGKVGIRGLQDQSALDRQCREMSVGCEIAGCSNLLQQR